MLTPKRHITTLAELTSAELQQMVGLHEKIIKKYQSLKLLDSTGKPFSKYEMLWRVRKDTFDEITGNTKPDHFHLNIYPFKDHHTDPVMEREAYLFDIREYLGSTI